MIPTRAHRKTIIPIAASLTAWAAVALPARAAPAPRPAFQSVIPRSNGVALVIGMPDGFTNRIDLYATSNLVDATWSRLVEGLVTAGRRSIAWTDTDVRAGSVLFYTLDDALTDSDGDGLSNLRELTHYLTDPHNPDSDGDGMGDGIEVAQQLNPLIDDADDDPDHDDLSNLQECAAGSNAHIANPVVTCTSSDCTLVYRSVGVTRRDDGQTTAELEAAAAALVAPGAAAWKTVDWGQGLAMTAGPTGVASSVVGAARTTGQRALSPDGLTLAVTNVQVGLSIAAPVAGTVYRASFVAWTTADGRPATARLVTALGVGGATAPLILSHFAAPGQSTVLEPVAGTNGTAYAESIAATLEAYEACRAADDTRVPDADKLTPGLLLTDNSDGGAWDPYEAKVIFKALPPVTGLTRYVRFSPAGRLELRSTVSGAGASVPVSAEVALPGAIDADYVRELAMYQSSTWGPSTTVTVSYIVKDAAGTVLAEDAVRLLRPVIMAVGDSVTFGFMRDYNGVYRTPPLNKKGTWSVYYNWSSYPTDSEWQGLSSPWNVLAHKTNVDYQGYRGTLAAALPGFLWLGENVNGHGPSHMGFNGALINNITTRVRTDLIGAGPCYAIILYWAGLNDVVGGAASSTMRHDWYVAMNYMLSQRDGRGKTLAIGITLPRMATYYGYYSSAKQNELLTLNAHIRAYAPGTGNPGVKYRYADVENVSHDTSGGVTDDGLHFFATGYRTIESYVVQAIQYGLRQ